MRRLMELPFTHVKERKKTEEEKYRASDVAPVQKPKT